MLILVNFFRSLMIVLTCAVLSACTPSVTSSSSYSGKIGAKSSVEKSRQAKIKASRKRAKAIREAERKKFLKKRNRYTVSSKSRAGKRRISKKRSTRIKRTRVSSRSASRKYSKRRKSSRKNSRRRIASKRNSKSRVKRIKKSSYAYVGGRSKGIRRNSKPWRCVPSRLKKVLKQISKKYGRVTINSTHRSRRHNRRVGGKRRSYHLRCQAVDFRVHGRTRGLTRWLANHPLVGGYNRYPSGYYHIDTGPKRTW